MDINPEENENFSYVNGEIVFDSDIGRHPMLQVDKIDGLLTRFPQRDFQKNTFADLLPMREYNVEKVTFEYEHAEKGGMTPVAARSAESPIYEPGFSRSQDTFRPVEFREKAIFSKKDVAKLRRIGTVNERENARRMINNKFERVQDRLMNRMAWLRRQVLFDRQVVAEDSDGNQISVPYLHANWLEKDLTGQSAWNDATSSDPVRDLQLWVRDMSESGAVMPERVYFGYDIMHELVNHEQFEDIMDSNYGEFRAEPGAIRAHLQDVAGLPEIVTNNDRIQNKTEVVEPAAQGADTVILRDAKMLSQGDYFKVRATDKEALQRFQVEFVSEVRNGWEVTVRSPVSPSGGFTPGDAAEFSKNIMPRDQVMITGTFEDDLDHTGAEAEPDPEYFDAWGEIVSTISYHNDLTNPQPGVFTKEIDNMDEDPPRWERLLGVRMLPRINYPTAWLTANVLD